MKPAFRFIYNKALKKTNLKVIGASSVFTIILAISPEKSGNWQLILEQFSIGQQMERVRERDNFNRVSP